MLLVIMNRRKKRVPVYFIRQNTKDTADRLKCSNWRVAAAEKSVLDSEFKHRYHMSKSLGR